MKRDNIRRYVSFRVVSACFVLLFLFFPSRPLRAGSLTFDGQVRERFEALDGMNKKAYGNRSITAKGEKAGDANDKLLLQRIIAGVTYKPQKDITFHLHMYDARVWGWSLDHHDFVKNPGTPDEFVMDPNEEYFELYDANVQIRDLFFKNFSTILGRQKIWYGDKRIFGPGGWGNSIGWLWDAARFSYQKSGNFIDAWYGQTKAKDPYKFSLFHKHAYQGVGIYSHFRGMKTGALEPFFAWKNSLFHDVKPEEKTFYGGARYFIRDFHGFNGDFTYVHEGGSIGNRDVDAYGYVARIGYRFEQIPMRPNIVIGRVFASGDRSPQGGTVRTFTRPFGSTDGEHYGRMDIMFWSNLVDNQVSLYLEPCHHVKIKLAFHDFYLDKPEDTWSYYKYKNKRGNRDTHLGNEYDVQLRYRYSKALEFQLIYAYFDAGNFVRHNVADNDAQRFFLQCLYKFNYRFLN